MLPRSLIWHFLLVLGIIFISPPFLSCLTATVEKLKADTESIVKIVYQPQAIFRVRAVTRCSATVPGHAEAVLAAVQAL